MEWTSGGVDITPLTKEGQVFQLSSVKQKRLLVIGSRPVLVCSMYAQLNYIPI